MTRSHLGDASSPDDGDSAEKVVLEVGPARITASHVGRFLKFGLVGAFGVLVNWGFFEVGYQLFEFAGQRGAAVAGYALGLLVSIFTNFVFNDIWTWADRQKGGYRHWFRRLGRYYLAASAAGVVQFGVSTVTFELVWSPAVSRYPGGSLPGVDWVVPAFDPAPRLGLLTGIAAGMIINFVASHLWAFQDAEEM